MKYYEITFRVTPPSQDATDLLCALAGEAGCESFEETGDGLKAYAQQSLFDGDMLAILTDDFPMTDVSISYEVGEAEDRDWNEAWEQEGFEPIIVKDELAGNNGVRKDTLIIHDGRHLPGSDEAAPNELRIEIDTHNAFGTGTHETTRMICRKLLSMDLNGTSVLDCGCGTGILAICALKLGSDCATAYDIDEWSTENTRHNSVINCVDHQLTILHGDASVLSGVSERFDVVMANINRNILLNDMPRFVSVMRPGATLIISGFYGNDCAQLISSAQMLGLRHSATHTDADWACLVFTL